MALNGIEAIHVATVMEDCVDQLAILGRIMPASYDARVDREEVPVLKMLLVVEGLAFKFQ